jgi:hypothetical protein
MANEDLRRLRKGRGWAQGELAELVCVRVQLATVADRPPTLLQ